MDAAALRGRSAAQTLHVELVGEQPSSPRRPEAARARATLPRTGPSGERIRDLTPARCRSSRPTSTSARSSSIARSSPGSVEPRAGPRRCGGRRRPVPGSPVRRPPGGATRRCTGGAERSSGPGRGACRRASHGPSADPGWTPPPRTGARERRSTTSRGRRRTFRRRGRPAEVERLEGALDLRRVVSSRERSHRSSSPEGAGRVDRRESVGLGVPEVERDHVGDVPSVRAALRIVVSPSASARCSRERNAQRTASPPIRSSIPSGSIAFPLDLDILRPPRRGPARW